MDKKGLVILLAVLGAVVLLWDKIKGVFNPLTTTQEKQIEQLQPITKPASVLQDIEWGNVVGAIKSILAKKQNTLSVGKPIGLFEAQKPTIETAKVSDGLFGNFKAKLI